MGAENDQRVPRSTDGGSAGSQGAADGSFVDLYRDVAPAVYSWAACHLHAPLRTSIEPEDVLQEVACRSYENFESYDPSKGDFRGWIFGIARRVLYQAMERLRSAGPTPDRVLTDTQSLGSLPDTATSITAALSRDEQIAAFLRVVDELPEDDRQMLVYRGLEGLPHERVAELMNLSPAAAMQRWSRLRTRLRESNVRVDFVAA